MKEHIRVIVSGGGTGGHIFPAIAIADALKKRIHGIEILFVGAKGRLEMEKVPAAGYTIKGLSISGLQRSLTLENLSFPYKVIRSIMDSRKIIKEFKPDVAVGVGGYASGPLLFTAACMNIPAVIQEQNSFPGKTNKWLSRRVDRICVAYDHMQQFFPANKIIMTGNPVRKEMVSIQGKKEEALQYFGLKNGLKTVLFIGGSLGARTINQSARECLPLLTANRIQVIWQTGKYYYPDTLPLISEPYNVPVKIVDFISRMDYAYAAADIVVSRAGAIAVSELEIIGKPVILVPSPNVAEDHQTKNALSLVNKNAAILIKDIEAVGKIGDEIIKLINDETLQAELAKNIKSIACSDSDEKITDVIIELINK